MSYALPEHYTQSIVVSLVDWYAFFIILDLVKSMTPVTLKSHTLADYSTYHHKQLFMLPIDGVIKSKLQAILDDLRMYLQP